MSVSMPLMRLAGVADFGETVRTQERILEVVPVLLEYRAVDAHAVSGELGLEADFHVGQEVRLVRWQRTATIDAARSEAFRPRGVQHHVIRGVPGHVEALGVAAFVRVLVEIRARRATEWLRPGRTRGFARTGREARAVAEEALERVLRFEEAN